MHILTHIPHLILFTIFFSTKSYLKNFLSKYYDRRSLKATKPMQRERSQRGEAPSPLTWLSLRGQVMWKREACSPRGSSGGVGRRRRLRVEHTITRISWRAPLVPHSPKATTPSTVVVVVVVRQPWVVRRGSQHRVRGRAGVTWVAWGVEGWGVGYTSGGFRCWPLLKSLWQVTTERH